MSNKQALIESLKLPLKQKGYKKKNQTWYREDSDLIIVFNIQNSSYSDDYYINLGIIIQKLRREGEGICHSNCDIWTRIPTHDKFGGCLMADKLIPVLETFETWYGTLNALRHKAIEGKLPIVASGEAVTFLTSVRLG